MVFILKATIPPKEEENKNTDPGGPKSTNVNPSKTVRLRSK